MVPCDERLRDALLRARPLHVDLKAHWHGDGGGETALDVAWCGGVRTSPVLACFRPPAGGGRLEDY